MRSPQLTSTIEPTEKKPLNPTRSRILQSRTELQRAPLAINPHSLASFRLTFFSSRAKDDPIDSQLLEELVRTHSDRLRPYQPETTTERKLDQYCRHRRSLLGLATKTELKLISTLKQYFPLAVNLFAAVGMKSDIALSFLSRWPTLNELQRAKAHTLRSFFYAHNSRSQSRIEKRLQQIGQAHNVTDDLALIEPLVLTTKCLVDQLRQFNKAIKEFDHKIKELFKSHPDHFCSKIFQGPENSWPLVFCLYLVRIALAGLTLRTSKNTLVSLR